MSVKLSPPLFLSLILSLCLCFVSLGQDLIRSLEQKKAMGSTSLVKNIRFENVGPTVMSGRVVDLDVNPDDPTEFYVAYASGGLWYTSNNGTSFEPVMDNSDTQNLGDIAVDWKNGTIWAGTGENNASRSSYAGIGILKSEDKGQSWKHMGLPDSHHIGRILINPNDPDNLVVGVTGHLYTPNSERGIYRTTDGGLNWEQTLFVNDETGVIDLVATAGNYNTIYAATWQKERKAWNFTGNGAGSAIYKSADGGLNWTMITEEGSGFPTGEGVGRIGLAVFDENTVYAVLDNQYRRDKKEPEIRRKGKKTKEDFKKMSREDFLKVSDAELNSFLKENKFPKKYSAEVVKEMVSNNEISPADVARYLDNANSLLFEFPVIGAEVYRSDDGGNSWKKMNEDYIDDLYYSYGYYFGQIRVDPLEKDKIYLAGVPLLKSEDGGKSFSDISGKNVHADHHALWINPVQPKHLINGNDGGVNITYDEGLHWVKNNTPSVGQFYAINVDYREPYNIYGGLQDNGVWMGPHNAKIDDRWHQTGHNPWKSIMGGDGMQIQIDRTDPKTVYTGFQFGNYYRLDLDDNSQEKIQPRNDLGEPAFRFNWQTPILLSPHNQQILYLGSNHLHRSMDRGDSWETISGDLTKGLMEGNVAFATLTTISESPFKFGHLYVGTDDGQIQKSKNGGNTWDLVSGSMPQGLWVSEVLASKHNKNRVFASLNGYRNDDFKAYIYLSDDGGKSWEDISNNIPDSPVNALAEDAVNSNLIFAGTDNGLYLSLDGGKRWELFQSGIPNVAIHDLVIQEEEKHLVVGTHGRSIYKVDISILQKLTEDILNGSLHIFELPEISYSEDWGNKTYSWKKAETPGLDISFYAKQAGVFSASVSTPDGVIVSQTSIKADKGINVLSYDVAFTKGGKSAYLKKYKRELIEAEDGKTYLPSGTYEVEIKIDSHEEKQSFKIAEK